MVDNFLFDKLTNKVPNSKSKSKRNYYICHIDDLNQCNFIVYFKSSSELSRLFIHFEKEHSQKLYDVLKKLITNHFNSAENLSSLAYINNYINSSIVPKISEENNNNFIKIQLSEYIKKKASDSEIDISQIDLNKLNQIILEKSIYDHMPISKICDKKHLLFFIQLIKLGFEFGRNSNIDESIFMRTINNIKIPRGLLNMVGNDYFKASMSYFVGADASFQIDASKLNKRRILTYIISAKQRNCESFLFDLDQDFEPNLDGYKESVILRIKMAKNLNINIVGITTDNLAVQIKALSHNSPFGIQKTFSDACHIIHLRCMNHLLNLSYKDWIKTGNVLTLYEGKIKHITFVLNNQKFYKHLKQKIPVANVTRWNSTFKSLEKILKIIGKIIHLYECQPKEIKKDLLEIKNDVLYVVSIGALKVYPLLYYFAKLTDHLQEDNVSCVEAVLIVEHYLRIIKQNIVKFNIGQAGKDLYYFMKKRLLLNFNNQLYQFLSLLTPEGIVRYRKKMRAHKTFNIQEDENLYFHTLIDQPIRDRKNSIDFLINETYIKYKHFEYEKKITNFNPTLKTKRKKRFLSRKQINSKGQSKESNKIEEEKELMQKTLDGFINLCRQETIEKARETYNIYSQNNSNTYYISNKFIDNTTTHIPSTDESEEEYIEESDDETKTGEETDIKIEANNANETEHENKSNDEDDSYGENETVDGDEDDETYDEENSYDENETDNGNETDNSDETDDEIINSDKANNQEGFNKPEEANNQEKINIQEGINKQKGMNKETKNKKIKKSYINQKEALQWKNISSLIVNNAQYFDMTKSEANKAVVELLNLISTPFQRIYELYNNALCSDSNFINYWENMKELNINKNTFKNISKLATRMYPISASEAGAERSFSRLKWRFTDRRNKSNKKTMKNEIFIENSFKNKIQTKDNFNKVLWKIPPHIQEKQKIDGE